MTDSDNSTFEEAEGGEDRPDVHDHIWHARHSMNDADYSRKNAREWDEAAARAELEQCREQLAAAKESIENAIEQTDELLEAREK